MIGQVFFPGIPESTFKFRFRFLCMKFFNKILNFIRWKKGYYHHHGDVHISIWIVYRWQFIIWQILKFQQIFVRKILETWIFLSSSSSSSFAIQSKFIHPFTTDEEKKFFIFFENGKMKILSTPWLIGFFLLLLLLYFLITFLFPYSTILISLILLIFCGEKIRFNMTRTTNKQTYEKKNWTQSSSFEPIINVCVYIFTQMIPEREWEKKNQYSIDHTHNIFFILSLFNNSLRC